MYYLFRQKGWTPNQYYGMDYGEKRVVHAFMIQEIEDQSREIQELKENYS